MKEVLVFEFENQIKEAERNGKRLYCPYHGLLLTPAEARALPVGKWWALVWYLVPKDGSG